MTLIYESPYQGWNETSERILVYALDEGEFAKLEELYRDENDALDAERLLVDLGLASEWYAPPGALFRRYYLEAYTTHHIVVSETASYNV